MKSLSNMIWVEWRKAVRSGMPLWTALGSLVLPLGVGFLIFVSRNPAISQNLGLISAKANLVAFAAADWPTYLAVFGQVIAVGGLFLFVLVISWVFGREFADGTVKDLLAVPVPRATILLAKFVVVAVWSAGLSAIIVGAGLLLGALIQLPAGSTAVLLRGSGLIAVTAGLTIALIFPYAFFASAGRGYLLPVGVAVLIVVLTNLVIVVGWGEYFPFAVAALYAEGKTALAPISYWLVILSALAGMLATYLWWTYADQNR